MNRTNFEHGFFGLLMQAAAWPFFGPWAGVWISLAYFWSREVMQRELYLKHFYGFDTLDKLKPFEGWRFWEWTWDSRLDVVLPLIATLAVAALDSWLALALLSALCGIGAYLDRVFAAVDRILDGY